jgi:hypothetical protein
MITQTITRPQGQSLYSIEQELQDALAAVEVDTSTGELIGFDRVDALQMSLHDKVVNVGRFIQNQGHLLDAMKSAKKTLDERIKSAERRIEAMKHLCEYGMQKINAKKIEEGDIAISLRKTSAVEVYDEAMIAPEFWTEKITRSVSKTALKDAIKAGADVQGARIVEHFSVQIK